MAWKRKINYVVCNYICGDNGKITRKKLSSKIPNICQNYFQCSEMSLKSEFWKNGCSFWYIHRKNNEVWLLWGKFKEYLKQNIITAVLRKANAHSVVICRLIKKINNVNKNRSKRKNWFKLCLCSFSEKESCVVHIFFYTTRGWNSR